MLLNKLKTVTMALVVAAMVGGAGLFYRTQAAEPAEEPPTAAGSQTEKGDPLANRDFEWEASEQNSRNLLSSSPMPRQALVSLDKGQLVVRTLDLLYEPTALVFEGQTHASYQKAEILRTNQYDTAMVKIYDVRGQSVNKGELPRLLERETVALVSTDAHAADPVNLRLFKEGTLLFILPGIAIPPPAAGNVLPGIAIPRPAAGNVYVPTPAPVTYAGPAPPLVSLPVSYPIAPPVRRSPLDAAKDEWTARIRDFRNGRGTQDLVYASARALLQAELEKGRSKEDRITARQAHLSCMSEIERINKEKYEAGRISAQDYQESVRWRLEAEKWLSLAKAN